jgi:hypothetical protein
MRGSNIQQDAMLSYLSPEDRVGWVFTPPRRLTIWCEYAT